ncbi:MAG TPA: hypothetical protein VJR27_01370 [Candidatus Saccharimonadales bacterium]|nr:hypothetical protein [Candidatus Saccharimonadales bacterium]
MPENNISPLDVPRLPLYLYLTGIVVLLLTGWLWWAKASTNPTRVFNGMLANSLSTMSTTLNLSQSGSSAKEAIQIQFGGTTAAHAVTTLSQNSNTVTTETIGTPTADYTRYTSIKTGKVGKNGKPLDLSKVQNVWAKTTAAEATNQQNIPLFQQAVLGIGLPIGSVPVPMGAVSSKDRAALLAQIAGDNVYSPNFSKMKKGTVHGRLAYAYPVTLQPVTYARLMQNFAKALGLHTLDTFDPNSLSGKQPIEMTFIVDAHAKQLVEIDYATGNYKETYSSYGAVMPVTLPKNPISNGELQQRLSVLEG